MTNESLIEGADDSVAVLVFTLVVLLLYTLKRAWDSAYVVQNHYPVESHRPSLTIDPTQLPFVQALRETLTRAPQNADDASGDSPPTNQRRFGTNETCPVCLAPTRFGITTNCGHSFCSACIIAFWRHSASPLSPVTCPVCRSNVNLLMKNFTEADPSEPGRSEADGSVNEYNRRFSGQPRTILGLIQDLPVIVPYLFSQLFTFQGILWMFQARVAMCFVGIVFYVLSPFDIIPEAVFGVFGLFDDFLIVFALLIYATVIYRNFMANQM